ncbi:GDSL-type esterase/lipase family protein [Blastococcus sp. SYSU D00820]
MTPDLRVCFVGDSFVAGVGDPEHRGWVGRLCAGSAAAGRPLTGYVLGVRRDTSRDVRARWTAECAARLGGEWDSRVVVSLGVNDTTAEGAGTRVPPEQSAANLAAVLDGIAERGWPVLVVGPPPVADPAQDERTAALDVRLAAVCADRGVPHVPVHAPLRASSTWMAEVAAGDGAHPAAAGYAELAGLVLPHWLAWLDRSSPAGR